MNYNGLQNYMRNRALENAIGFDFDLDLIRKIYESDLSHTLGSLADLDDDDVVVSLVRHHLKKWCKDQAQGDYEFYAPSPYSIRVKFVRNRDAMLFKLAWVGERS